VLGLGRPFSKCTEVLYMMEQLILVEASKGPLPVVGCCTKLVRVVSNGSTVLLIIFYAVQCALLDVYILLVY